jgi:hypothetical protein
MIQSPKRDQNWSFWSEIIKISKFFLCKKIFKVVEAIEVSQAAEVKEAA